MQDIIVIIQKIFLKKKVNETENQISDYKKLVEYNESKIKKKNYFIENLKKKLPVANSKEIVSSLIFEKKSLQNQINLSLETQKELQKELAIAKDDGLYKTSYFKLIQEFQIVEIESKKKSQEIEAKINEIYELRQEIEIVSNKHCKEIEKNSNLEKKNHDLQKKLEEFNSKFNLLTSEFEDKKNKELAAYSQNLANINKVLSSSKLIIIALREENEKTKNELKSMNENCQTLSCKNSYLLKIQNEINHKMKILNVFINFLILTEINIFVFFKQNYYITEEKMHRLETENKEISLLLKKYFQKNCKFLFYFFDFRSLEENLNLKKEIKNLEFELSSIKTDYFEINKINASLIGHKYFNFEF